jgi:hypothetical protein
MAKRQQHRYEQKNQPQYRISFCFTANFFIALELLLESDGIKSHNQAKCESGDGRVFKKQS